MAHIHGVFDSDAHFSVDPITKTLKNESSQKTTVIQKDHNSERFTFEIPRMIEGHDMSLCNDVKVHYINIDASTKQENKGVYVVDDMQISKEDDQVVICSWLVSGNATQLKGPLSFSISYSCVTDDLDYCLNTAAYKAISVAEGVYCGDYVAEEYADILVQWEEELKKGVTDEQIQDALNAYLAENPISETDPTVPDWAKAPSKPRYNLSELTEDANHRTVTDAEKTAWNNKSNFSGAYDDLTGKPTIPDAYTKAEVDELLEGIGTGGGSGGGESGGGGMSEFQELFRVTTTEEVKKIQTGIDLRNYSEIVVICNKVVASDGTSTGHFCWNVSGADWLLNGSVHNTQLRTFFMHAVRFAPERWYCISSYSSSSDTALFKTDKPSWTLANNVYTTDKTNYTSIVLYNANDDFEFGVYQYNQFNLAAGVEAVVYGR